MYKTAGSWGIESVKPNSVESFSVFFFVVFFIISGLWHLALRHTKGSHLELYSAHVTLY